MASRCTKMEGSSKGLYFEKFDGYTYISVKDGLFHGLHKQEFEGTADAYHYSDEEFVCPVEYLL